MNNIIDIIYNNIIAEEPVKAKILLSPYFDNLSDRAKIDILHRFLLQAIKRKH